jgi:hypothetical protein
MQSGYLFVEEIVLLVGTLELNDPLLGRKSEITNGWGKWHVMRCNTVHVEE